MKVMAVRVYLKKGSLSAWKANEALITNFKSTAMRFLLGVKDQIITVQKETESSISGLSERHETFQGYFALSVGS